MGIYTHLRSNQIYHPASSATCANDVHISLSGPDEPDGGLFVVDDVTTSSGKRVVAFSSDACLAILNQAHKVVFIDGTFKVSPKNCKQIWIVRGNVGNTCVPLMYFLLEDKSGPSYSKSLEILTSRCSDFKSEDGTFCHKNSFSKCNNQRLFNVYFIGNSAFLEGLES